MAAAKPFYVSFLVTGRVVDVLKKDLSSLAMRNKLHLRRENERRSAMELLLMRTFQRQIQFQCRCLIFAAADIDNGLKSRDVNRTFYAVQNFLNAAANISKALYGSGGNKKSQRKPPRDSIGVGDESLFKSVSVRNHFEHFDERIDRWWKEYPEHNVCDMNISSRESISGIGELGWFRNFDNTTSEVTFWSEDFHTKNIYDEVLRLLPKIDEEVAKPAW